MPQSDFYSYFERKLLPQEQLIAVAGDIYLAFHWVPHALPTQSFSAGTIGALALTSYRLIIAWEYTKQVWKTLHIPSLNYVSERPLSPDVSNGPYQATAMIPGGLILVV